MRLTHQLGVAAVLGVATYFALYRIAEGKSEAAVGGASVPIDVAHGAEMDAFLTLRSRLAVMGDAELSARLDRLRSDGELRVAPRLGPERWAVFVDALSLVRRVYVRGEALRDPVAHLYRAPRPDIPRDYQEAHAWLSLAGALRHEIAHRDGIRDEGAAYEAELAWYESLRASGLLDRLRGEDREAWRWGLESAVLSARKARETAGVISAPAASP